MLTLNIRKQGGAAVITLPSDILKLLDIEIGDELTLTISDKKLILRPTPQSQRYTLADLLEGVTEKDIKSLKQETEWFREGKSTGREI